MKKREGIGLNQKAANGADGCISGDTLSAVIGKFSWMIPFQVMVRVQRRYSKADAHKHQEKQTDN